MRRWLPVILSFGMLATIAAGQVDETLRPFKLVTTSTDADSIDAGGGINAGTGNVQVADATGKLPAFTSGNYANLSGANFTALNASQLTSGTCGAARGCTGLDTSASTGVPKLDAGTWSVQALTNGQLLIGSTGATPVAATLIAGANISIANTAGSITITGTGGGPITRLDAVRGSSTATTLTTFRSVSLSGLTVLDRIRAVLVVRSTTQQTAGIRIAGPGGACMQQRTLTASQEAAFEMRITADLQNTTDRTCHVDGRLNQTTDWDELNTLNSGTDWTAPWNLDFVHGGVVSGGTLWYYILVFKEAGQ